MRVETLEDSSTTRARLRSEVAGDLAAAGAGVLAPLDRKELARTLTLSRLQNLAAEQVRSGMLPMGAAEEHDLAKAVLNALFGMGSLQELIDDPEIENIDVNGSDQVWVTYADGTKAAAAPVADSDEHLVEIVRSSAARLGLSERRFDTAHPELDLCLPDGSRLSALMSVSRRPLLSIRRHRFTALTLEDLVGLGAFDAAMGSFLASCVRARKNIVVAGGMNSGKTTLVRALASEIGPRERVVTIEQAFELGLDSDVSRHPDLVALEARGANTEGEGEIPMARLVRRALRMNADRVIVGEVLGDEVLPMLNAMSQGRSGSMCTIHADSSAGAFRRIASYAVQAAERLPVEATNLLIAGAIHFVVFVDVVTEASQVSISNGRSWPLDHDGLPLGRDAGAPQRFEALPRRRFVSSVREVVDADGMQVVSNEVFRPGPGGRAVTGAPLRFETLEELSAHGYQPALGSRI